MARFHVGTSGWQYDHWRGVFYPEKCPRKDWFSYYVSQFDTVELNSSFYRLPRAASWDAWQRAAPEGFRYAVKASRFITHIKRLRDPTEPLKRLFDGADRLGRRLGPVLYQTPPTFHRTKENIDRFRYFLTQLPLSRDHVFEFRHKSWFGQDTLAELADRHAGFCIHDALKGDCPVVATSSFAYLRLHGSSAKYASDYSDEELRLWANRLMRLTASVDDVWVYFNNDLQGFAPANARRLKDMLA